MSINNHSWDSVACDNYLKYVDVTKELETRKFAHKCNLPVNDDFKRRLEDLATEGYQVRILDHFDEDGRKVEGVMEVYVRAFQR